MTTKTCNKNECDRGGKLRRGMCSLHYHRERLGGSFTSPTVLRFGVGDTEEERFWSRVSKAGPTHPTNPSLGRCWEWQGCTDGDRYGQVRVNRKRMGAHRAAWYYIHGVWPTKYVLHSCDNPPCVNPDHLREGTYQDNMDDKVSRGRHSHGEIHGNAKLTEAQVIEIRRLFAAGGITQTALAEIFGAGNSTIGQIVHMKSWQHIGHGTNKPQEAQNA